MGTESWLTAKLGDLGELVLGKMRDDAKQKDGEVLPYVRNVNVRWGWIDLADLSEMTFNLKERERFNLLPGDVLICEGGEPGRSAIWKSVRGLENVKFQKAIHRFRSQAIVPEWLIHRLRFDATRGHLSQYFTGTTIKHLTKESLQRYTLPIPPLAEQHRIVAKIEELTACSETARQALDAIPPLLEKFRQCVLAAAFRGDLTREWRKNNPLIEPARVLLERISVERGKQIREARSLSGVSDLEQGDIQTQPALPDGWQWSNLGECFEVCVGATPSRKELSYWEGGIPWVSSGEISFCRIQATRETISAAGLKKSSTSLHPRGTVLVGMIGEGKTRGQVAILDVPACNNQNSAAIRVSQTEISPDYVYHWLESQYESNRRIGSGNNQQALNKRRVQAIPIPMAPLDEQREILSKIQAQLEILKLFEVALENGMTRLSSLDRSILSKAFRGELVVQDQKDELAAVLLHRIRTESTRPSLESQVSTISD